jgi:signal peptidase I
VKRVIGIPGDTVRLAGFSVSLKPRGGSDFVPEKQLIPGQFEIRTSLEAKGWGPNYPLAGNSEEVRLGDEQYFVLGDNRTESSDSRSWGPVTMDRIVGKVIYRYWPPRAIGTP